MEEKTTQLIEQLAQKLGTTSEYLWGILVSQAKVSAVSSLIFIAITVTYGLILFRLHKRFSKPDEKSGNSFYYDNDELSQIPMIFGAFILVILTIFSLVEISNVINGFMNPEYWALNQVLSLIK